MSPQEEAAYRREIEQWQAERQASLSDPEGWRALVGLDWLEVGETTVGAGDDNDVVLDTGDAPPHLGTLVVIDTDSSEGMGFTEGPESVRGSPLRVRFRPAPERVAGDGDSGDGPVLTADGQPVTGDVPIVTDLAATRQGGDPTVLEYGDLELTVIARRADYETRLALRTRDRGHPRLQDPPELAFFPIDPSFRFEARFEPFDPPRQLPVVNVLGMRSLEDFPGALVFERDDVTHRLSVLPEGDELFVIFSDPTNDDGSTYPAGRYLYARRAPQDEPQAEGAAGEEGPASEGTGAPAPPEVFILDFNRAYNPPCAFTDHATCPLPPPGNQLPFAVTAGAKYDESYGPHGGESRAATGQEGEDGTTDEEADRDGSA